MSLIAVEFDSHWSATTVRAATCLASASILTVRSLWCWGPRRLCQGRPKVPCTWRFRYCPFSEVKGPQVPSEREKRKSLSRHLDTFAGSFLTCTQSSFHPMISGSLNLSRNWVKACGHCKMVAAAGRPLALQLYSWSRTFLGVAGKAVSTVFCLLHLCPCPLCLGGALWPALPSGLWAEVPCSLLARRLEDQVCVLYVVSSLTVETMQPHHKMSSSVSKSQHGQQPRRVTQPSSRLCVN